MFFRFNFIWLPKVGLAFAIGLAFFSLTDFEFSPVARDICSLGLLGSGICGAFSAIYLFAVGQKIACPLCGETSEFYLLHDNGTRYFCVYCENCGIVGVRYSWFDTVSRFEPEVIPECDLPDDNLRMPGESDPRDVT